MTAPELRTAATDAGITDALLVIHPDYAPASALASLLEHGGKGGFVVIDMPDVDQFSSIESAALLVGQLYLVGHIDRGDKMANWSPDEAHRPVRWVGRQNWVSTASGTTRRTDLAAHQEAAAKRADVASDC